MTSFLANSHPKQSPKRRITSRLVGKCKTTRFQPNEFKADSPDRAPIPNVEWWDMPLLRSDNYSDVGSIEDNLRMEKITIYVQHPEPLAESLPPIPAQPIRLTSKERKKLRTQHRLLREKDRQEAIRQGLMEAPKDKVKMSNVFYAAGSEVVQEPTKSERRIRAATAERLQAHVDRNIARKLTPAECSEKKKRKLFHDSNCSDTVVSVYRINNQVEANLSKGIGN
ncbi:protein RDM16-like [Silene latifolia]|uniref:protein RDM16-like n=1 Tax=Silene latifolia TaxID=37657 RepID=UPI003D779149